MIQTNIKINEKAPYTTTMWIADHLPDEPQNKKTALILWNDTVPGTDKIL